LRIAHEALRNGLSIDGSLVESTLAFRLLWFAPGPV
jgi:hypothetical protein